MDKVTLFRFCVYDVRMDELVTSKRWGTRAAIARIGGQVIETSSCEAEPALVRSDIDGLTAVGFAPSPEPICVADRSSRPLVLSRNPA